MRTRRTLTLALLAPVALIAACSDPADRDVAEIAQVAEASPESYREALKTIDVDSEYIPGPGLEEVNHAVVLGEREDVETIDLVVFGSSSCAPDPFLTEVHYNDDKEIEELVFQATVHDIACTKDYGAHFYQVDFSKKEDLSENIVFTYNDPLQVDSESEITKVEAS